MKKQQEIDLAELFRRVWLKKWMVMKFTAAAVVVGLAVALLSPVKFTATTIIVPQSASSRGGTLQGLAAIAGIEMGNDAQGEVLSPMVYPMVVASTPFQKDIIHSTGMLSSPSGTPAAEAEEYACRKRLAKILALRVDQKNGYIALSATMPTAEAAARIASRAQELLEQYITRFKVQKARADLDFVEARYREVKAEFEARQNSLAAFQDANRDISSAVARSRENRLTNEYNLAFSIYSDIARQREQAAIEVKKETPIFTVVEPVTVPVEKSAPHRALILMMSCVIGFFVGAGVAILFPGFKI
jgi:uncharacterized protein involved in exopolysaccharide biosynthesis